MGLCLGAQIPELPHSPLNAVCTPGFLSVQYLAIFDAALKYILARRASASWKTLFDVPSHLHTLLCCAEQGAW
jgi:hypothetical protein